MSNFKVRLEELFWNAVGAGLTACQAAILLIFVARKQPIEVAGMVTIAFAVANIIFAIARYGVRNFQATDISEEYKFGDYFYHRIFTCVVALICGLIFLFFQWVSDSYSAYKILIMTEIICLRLIDGVEDVYLGHFQLKDHFLVGAKIMAIKKLLVTGVMCSLVYMSVDVVYAGMAGIVISVATDYLLIKKAYYQAGGVRIGQVNIEAIKALAKKCLPLAIGTTLSIYVGNIPKYVIDYYMTEKVQAVFGYIMLPVFVLTLFNQFIYTPFVKDLGVAWNDLDKRKFVKKVGFHCTIILTMSVVFILALAYIGLPVLSVLYDTNLEAYKSEYIVLLFGGCVYALDFYLIVPMTAMRLQKQIAIGYVFATAFSLIFGKYFVYNWDLIGVSIMYLMINTILMMFYMVVMTTVIMRGLKYNND